MTQTLAPSKLLYEQDLNLWVESAIAQLKVGDFQNLDVENLIEELEGLAGRDKRELATRLERLIEHILKRCYVDLPDCYRGWEVTIVSQRNEIKKLLKQSPSLKRHLSKEFDESFDNALEIVRIEYSETIFSNTWQFNRDIDSILNIKFWE